MLCIEHKSLSALCTGGSGSQAGRGPGGSTLDAETTAAVADYVSSLLKPMYRAKRLSKEDCKWVTAKATAKVAEHGPSESGSRHFMSTKRKLKVRL